MPTIEERAREMLNEIAVKRDTLGRWWSGDTRSSSIPMEALCRALEAHDATLAELAAKDAEFEAFKRKVSDEIERCSLGDFVKERLSRFIIPKPVDPLIEAVCSTFGADIAGPGDADKFRAALAKRGGRIVFEGVGDAD